MIGAIEHFDANPSERRKKQPAAVSAIGFPDTTIRIFSFVNKRDVPYVMSLGNASVQALPRGRVVQRKRYIEKASRVKPKMTDDPDVMLVRFVMAGGPKRWLWYQPEAAEREVDPDICEREARLIAVEMPVRTTISFFSITIAGLRRARAGLSEALRRRRAHRHPHGGRIA
ncbi:MAG: hypothetical protein ACREF3_13185 [Acetobacteraceae bacterium]